MSILSDINTLLRDGSRGLTKSADSQFIAEATVEGIGAGAIYAANDAVGRPFSVDVPKAGWITGLKLIDPDDDTLALTAHVYSNQFVGAADNAAYAVDVAYARHWVTNVTFSTVEDEGGHKVSEVVGETFYRAPGGKLWIQCSTTGTPNIAAGAMPILQIGIRPAAEA